VPGDALPPRVMSKDNDAPQARPMQLPPKFFADLVDETFGEQTTRNRFRTAFLHERSKWAEHPLPDAPGLDRSLSANALRGHPVGLM